MNLRITTTASKMQAEINKASMEDGRIDREKYICVTEDDYNSDDFTPPSAWCVQMATGDYMYLKARDRKKAQALADIWFGKMQDGSSKYTVRSDKKIQIR